jgi:hypothetical protein
MYACQDAELAIFANPLYALKQIVTGTLNTGDTLYKEFATGHVGEAIGTIATLAAITKKVADGAVASDPATTSDTNAGGATPKIAATAVPPAHEIIQSTARTQAAAGVGALQAWLSPAERAESLRRVRGLHLVRRRWSRGTTVSEVSPGVA